MDIKAYQEFTPTTAIYPKDDALEYLALGLANESGEVCGKVKKYLRGDFQLTDENKLKIVDEIGDVLWYVSQLLNELGYKYNEVLERNYLKLTDRKNRNVIKGDGDNR